MVPVPVKLALRSVRGQVICPAGVALFPVSPDAPPLLKYMTKDNNGKEEVSARHLFCGLQVGCLFGVYKTQVKFLGSVYRRRLLVS